MDYTGNTGGADSSRESVMFGSETTLNADFTGGTYLGQLFMQLDTFDSTGANQPCLFATPATTKIFGPNINIRELASLGNRQWATCLKIAHCLLPKLVLAF